MDQPRPKRFACWPDTIHIRSSAKDRSNHARNDNPNPNQHRPNSHRHPLRRVGWAHYTPSHFGHPGVGKACECERNAMTCTHEPSSPIAAFFFTCKHCGEAIESVGCHGCYGIGRFYRTSEFASGWEDCPDCKGTGVDHWEVMK